MSYRSARPILTICLILLTAAAVVVAATQLAADQDTGPTTDPIRDLGVTRPFRSPTFVPGGTPALIWSSPDAAAPLLHTPLEQPEARHPILAYPGIEPIRWAAAPAAPGMFHLVWLEADARLYYALLGDDGQTRRGPIDLAEGARSDFAALPLSGGGARIIWADAGTSGVMTATITARGFPQPVETPLLDHSDALAAAVDQSDTVHVAWLAESGPSSWVVMYDTLNAEALALERPEALLTFTLERTESITGLYMGLDQTHVYVFWSVMDAAQPDVERIFWLAFPFDGSNPPVFRELSLNQSPFLRWPRPAAGQHDLLPLALTLRTAEGWRPAVLTFRHGTLLDARIVASAPADAAPPAVLLTAPDKRPAVVWAGLDGARPHLYLTAE